jgi:hypothetical protein
VSHVRVTLGTWIGALLIAIAAVLMAAAPAFAAEIEIAVGAPERVSVGQDVEIKALLHQDRAPLEGAEVAVTYQTSIAGESGWVELATAVTDATGTALMTYQQRADDNGEMQVVYLGPDADPVKPYTFTIAVEAGGEQLYQQQTGVKIPFVNGTLVIVVISGVWFLIALAAIYLVRVGRAGRIVNTASSEGGSMWISVALASAAIITAIGMVIVFVRAPVSNTHITNPDGYDRTIVNYLDLSYPYEGFGLDDESDARTGDPLMDGSVLYFQYACAACHGLTGQGAVVGGALVGEIGSFGSFTDDVREGPKGMPGYGKGTISDEDLEKVYAYLKDGD